MVAEMAGEGFARDTQCFLRGNRTLVPDDQLWVAIKEGQNAILSEADMSVDFYFALTDGTKRTKDFKIHAVGSRAPIVLWMKRRQTNKWHKLGKYTLGPIRDEHHDVIKRGKPYHTAIARRATRVGA
jgi:hypothetical protein